MEEAFSTHFLELEKTEEPVDYADEETRQKVRSCAWNTVKAYMASDEVASQMPLGVEVGLSATIPGLPVPVRGVIDLVQHDLTAVDYKSARKGRSVSRVMMQWGAAVAATTTSISLR